MEGNNSETSKSTCNNVVTSGSTSALNVAFNDLKRRYFHRQTEMSDLMTHNHKMTTELQQSMNATKILERKIEQLQNSLHSKVTAYNNLEAAYKQTRVHEESLIKNSNENEKILEDSFRRLKYAECENDQLRFILKEVYEEKRLLELKLQELNQMSEITVSKQEVLSPSGNFPKRSSHLDDTDGLTYQSDLERQIQNLNAENQNLRTNVHWLSKELKANREHRAKRIRRDSDSLEEGKKVPNGNEKILSRYIKKSHKTVHSLKELLLKNNKCLESIIYKKRETTGVGYETIDPLSTDILSKSQVHNQKNYKETSETLSFERENTFKTENTNMYTSNEANHLSKVAHDDIIQSESNLINLESGSSKQILSSLKDLHIAPPDEKLDETSGNAIVVSKLQMQTLNIAPPDEKNEKVPGNAAVIAKLEMHKRIFPNMWGLNKPHVVEKGEVPLKKVDVPFSCNQLTKLPPSIMENVQQQQTQTYLTSKTFINQLPHIHEDHTHKTLHKSRSAGDIVQVKDNNYMAKANCNTQNNEYSDTKDKEGVSSGIVLVHDGKDPHSTSINSKSIKHNDNSENKEGVKFV